MASADFSASSFRRYRRPWPFRADGEISRNKTHFFRPAGCGFTTLLRLGLGLRHVMLTCPQVGLVSAFCAYPPNFASDFLHPRPRGRKLVLGYLVPPNWPIGDFHSRPCVMSCVQRETLPALAERALASALAERLRFRLEEVVVERRPARLVDAKDVLASGEVDVGDRVRHLDLSVVGSPRFALKRHRRN